MPRLPRRLRIPPLAEFLRAEAAGGAVLLSAALTAVVWASASGHGGYERLWSRMLAVGAGGATVRLTLRQWVNDGLMTVFFFVVGLEIKRELVTGELRDRRTAALPAIAALGGMVAPAVTFAAVTAGHADGRGWGIPMATDVAFVVGVLALLGARVPAGLRLFLLTLAIVDDIGAIVVIALFYARGIAFGWLVAAVAMLGVMAMARRAGVVTPWAYVPLAVGLWVCAHESGLHATIAGVALGLLTPATPVRGRRVLEEVEHRVHPWSSFLVVPLFALANTGVALRGGVLGDAWHSRVTWGVVAGLAAGKLVGICGATALALRLGIGRRPADVERRHLLGAGALAGIGFTVSLFVADLAYPSGARLEAAKIGVLAASLVSGTLGSAILLTGRNPGRAARVERLR